MESNKTVWHDQDTVATLLSSLVQFATLLSNGRNAQINSRDDYFFFIERETVLLSSQHNCDYQPHNNHSSREREKKILNIHV